MNNLDPRNGEALYSIAETTVGYIPGPFGVLYWERVFFGAKGPQRVNVQWEMMYNLESEFWS